LEDRARDGLGVASPAVAAAGGRVMKVEAVPFWSRLVGHRVASLFSSQLKVLSFRIPSSQRNGEGWRPDQ
jgi:hypothetical protein